jgi:plastocyanin
MPSAVAKTLGFRDRPKEGNMAVTQSPPVAVARPRVRAPFTRIAALGGLLAGLGGIIILIGALGSGLGDEIGFFLPVVLFPLIGAALTWRFGTWAKVVGLVSALAIGLMMFWAVFGLAYPGSVYEFVPGVLIPLGVVLALVGNIGAIVRRRHPKAAIGPVERNAVLVVVAVAAVAMILSAVVALTTGGESVAAEDAEGATPVVMKGFEFTEETYRASAGEATTFHIRNEDRFVHTFTIPALGIDETVHGGQEALVEVDAPAGTYTIYCAPHSDTSEDDPEEAGMAATLVVE